MEREDASLPFNVKIEIDVAEEPETLLIQHSFSSGCQRSKAAREQDALSCERHSHNDSDIMAASRLMTHKNIKAEPAAHKATLNLILCDNIKTEPAVQEPTQPCENIKTEPDSYESIQPCENTEGEPALCKTNQHLRTCLKIKTEPTESHDPEVSEEWRDGTDCQVKREPLARTSVASLQQENLASSPCPVRQEGDVKDWDEGSSAWEPSSAQKQANSQAADSECKTRLTPSPPNAEFLQRPGNTGPTPVMLVANLGQLLLAQRSQPFSPVTDHGQRDLVQRSQPFSPDLENGRLSAGLSQQRTDPNQQHVCDVCNKAFMYKSRLDRHKLVHTGERSYVCDVCSKTFNRESHLKTHKLIHTDHRPYVCDVCSKAFNKAHILKTHKLIHTGQRPFVCNVCNKTFNQASILKRHKMVHTSQGPFVCDVCSKAFCLEGDMNRHKLVHTDQRPFVCDVCSKAFNHSFHLNAHKLIHTGLKPFVCDVCSKCFNRASHLKRHKLIHIASRPFACDVCAKTFNEEDDLQRHKMIHGSTVLCV